MENNSFKWLTENSRKFLSSGYLTGDTTPEERIREMGDNAERILKIDGFSDKFYKYMSQGFYSLASPVWSNFGKKRGLPISCFGSSIADDMGDILYTQSEVGMMSKLGGGTSGYFGNLRSRGSEIKNNGTSSGSVHMMQLFEKMVDVVSQGCYDDKTEVLTNKGFMFFEDVIKDKTIKVAQVSDDDVISFVQPLDYFKYDVDEELYRFIDDYHTDLLVTGNHNMVFKKEQNKESGKRFRSLGDTYHSVTAEKIFTEEKICFLHSSNGISNGIGLTNYEKFLICLNLHGEIDGKNSVEFTFISEKHRDRIIELLNELKLEFETNSFKDKHENTFTINVFDIGLNLYKSFEDWVDLEKISKEWSIDFLQEIADWSYITAYSGDEPNFMFVNYKSEKEIDIDILQTISLFCGLKTIKNFDRYSNAHLNISKDYYYGSEALTPRKEHYKGFVYCVEVPSNKLLVRRNGKVTVCGNSVRRGRFSPYLPVEHQDIKEFLEIGTEGNPIQELTHGVTVGDKWMQEMVDGDREKRGIWAKILQRRGEIGYPYIMFRDTANNNTVDVYKDKSKDIVASNLCVAPNTQILTRNGYTDIKSLKNKTLDIWNGQQWSEVTVKKTGVNQQLLRVETNSGYSLDCTEYHKFYVQKGYNKGTGKNKLSITEVRAVDLKKGDKLIKFKLPIIQGEKRLENAYVNGFYSGDGCLTVNGQRIYLYHEKRNLKHKFNIIEKWSEQPNEKRIYGHTEVLEDKFFVPNAEYTIQDRLEWLSGYLDAVGTVTNNNGSQSLQIACVELEFLKEVQLMLQTLGCDSKVRKVREKGEYLLPKNDGSGELGLYKCKEVNRLLINGNSLYKLTQLGLTCERLVWKETKPNRECSNFIKIKSVTELPNLSDTYCFNEPLEHKGMFNGILTGQCSEIMLPSDENWSFVCCLSSINLLHYDQWKDTDAVETLTYFLDAVMDEFITKLEVYKDSTDRDDQLTFSFMKKAYQFAKENRALGLGALGWHSLLQSKMLPFDSGEAYSLNSEIFKTIKERSYKASEEMAKLYGEPSILKGYGRRNTTLNAIAPTTSSAFILGQVSQGIEPIWSNIYVKDIAKIKTTIKNPILEKLLEEKGKNTKDVWNSIRDRDGSVLHLDFLTEHEKEVFRTYPEIDQKVIVYQASNRQAHIDQGQSINVMVHPDMPIKDVNDIYITAWKLGIKSMYYQHSMNASQKFKQKKECASCEG